MDNIEALIQSRVTPKTEIEQTLEHYTNSSVLAFKEHLSRICTLQVVQKMKIEDHLCSIISRLLVTTRLNREITYGELRSAMSQRIRNKFDSALQILITEKLVIENTKRGKCYYKLNVLLG